MNRRVSSALTVFAYFTAIGLLFFGYHYLEVIASGGFVSPLEPLINELFTGAWMAALLFPFVARVARRYPVSRATWTSWLPAHVGGLLAYSVAHTSLLWLSRSLLYPLFGLPHYNYGIMVARYPMEFFHDAIVYPVLISILTLFDRHVRAAQLETQLARARLDNLKLQMQPHFLFNALNTISSVLYEDPRRADAMIAALGKLLRETIDDAETPLVPLEREIATLERYLAIMRQRFEDKLTLDVRVDPQVRTALVPHLLLQPLIENAIKHGADPHSHVVDVTLVASRDGGRTRLGIRDRGPGLRNGAVRRGTGLNNTAERLAQLYGAEHAFEFENCSDGGLLVTVAVPYRT
jgi:two-component system, LytTR family, sensor kinase